MKKLFCFLLCLTLVFSSISLCFATSTDWDTSDQANLRAIKNLLDSGGGIYNMISTISSRTNTISNTLTDIKDLLSYSNHSIADLVDSILTWMSPIYNSINSIPVDLTSIKQALWKDLGNGSSVSYLHNIELGLSRGVPWSSSLRWSNANANLVDDNGQYTVQVLGPNGTTAYYTYNWTSGTPLGNIAFMLRNLNQNISDGYKYYWQGHLNGFTTAQTYYDPLTLNTSTFTPTSQTIGLYTWLSKIQQPAARLAYVLASPERIAAQEAAADNEEAVVDNFIDSSGDGSASPSDIGSMSDLSSGYKQNFGSDASPSGIFDIFNSDHATWFSQETKNQLDTTTPTRLSKGSESETPLLDKQIQDIYDALGVKQP